MVVNTITQSNVHFAEAGEMQGMLQEFYDDVLYDHAEVIDGESPAEDFYCSTIWWRE